jgi:hypothetical protein
VPFTLIAGIAEALLALGLSLGESCGCRGSLFISPSVPSSLLFEFGGWHSGWSSVRRRNREHGDFSGFVKLDKIWSFLVFFVFAAVRDARCGVGLPRFPFCFKKVSGAMQGASYL